MSKGPTDAALNYTPAEPEVYRAGYLTAMEHSTSIDDARHLYDVLYQEHGRLTHKQPRTRRTRRTTEAERLDMVNRWRAGEDFAAIAKHYGLAKVTVYTHIKKRVTDAEREAISRQTADCGTRAGYKRHRNRGEQPCDECRLASNAKRVEQYGRARLRFER